MKIIVQKEPLNDIGWHYCHHINTFIDGIEDGTFTNRNTEMAFFVRQLNNGEGELYIEPSIHKLDADYLRKMRDEFKFKTVMIFGGGGIED